MGLPIPVRPIVLSPCVAPNIYMKRRRDASNHGIISSLRNCPMMVRSIVTGKPVGGLCAPRHSFNG